MLDGSRAQEYPASRRKRAFEIPMRRAHPYPSSWGKRRLFFRYSYPSGFALGSADVGRDAWAVRIRAPSGSRRGDRPCARPRDRAFTSLYCATPRSSLTIVTSCLNSLRHPSLNSSVHTLKPFSVLGPKVLLIGTSAASRPRAISTRPMRGVLFRASKVYQ